MSDALETAEKNRNLSLRVGSAATLFPVAVFLTVKGGLPFALICGAVASGGAAELVLMFERRRLGVAEGFGVVVAGLFPVAAWYGWESSRMFFPPWIPIALALAVVLLLVLGLFRDAPLEEIPRDLASVALGWLYSGVLMAVLVALRMRCGFEWVILAFVVTWGNDTLAYFAGRAFGRHKLFPRISPKKTWEGFMGGAVGSVLFAFVMKGLFLPALAPAACLAIGVGGAVLGPLGDLAESMLKRAAGVKDSGRLIPGHGGLLDRIDALLFVTPWVLLVAAVLGVGS